MQTDIKILIEIIIGDIVSASGGLQGWINHAGDVSMIVTFIFPRLAVAGLAPIFPYTFYHLTHYWFAAADIPV
ncbi:hypothetical protein, partial [Enterobacter kobei]|uniref:hypothetical protein n=1 Tax=Enterobacter kobei TaxID=208224 RepID=UPI0020752D1A